MALPPEAISFAYAGDSEPVASNATEAGREQNRRVEVEVWYDEKREALAMEEVVVSDETKRVKVCRTETVCKLRYREGHERRARIRNLIAPLHIAEDTASVPDDFVRQVRQALDNLRDRQNVTVKFIGYTDDTPLEGRAARIYGTHLAVSKARAHRVARAIQDRLQLDDLCRRERRPRRGVPGRFERNGARPRAQPAHRGRVLVRRSAAGAARRATAVSRSGRRRARDEGLRSALGPHRADLDRRRRAAHSRRLRGGAACAHSTTSHARLPDASNVRLRFVGYTRNERLDRRTAAVYGDDVGLSAARARRTMEQVLGVLALPRREPSTRAAATSTRTTS